MKRSSRLALCGAVLAVVTAWPLARGEEEVPTNRRIAQVFDLVYQIKTATDAHAPKASYGSGFVVAADGLLATNFHVVSTALHEPGKYKLYLIDGQTTLPAEVVAFDAANDLALVKVARVFPRAVTFAKRMPEAGAKIYSIGLPEDLNKSVIEGNFNGLMKQGPYEKLQMSIPLNPGMSGGPTLGENGEILGVNVSLRVDSQNLAFAVPKSLLEALIAKPRGNFSRPEAKDAFDEEVRDQLDEVQQQLTALLTKGQSEVITLDGWQAEKPAEAVKCWRETENGARELASTTVEQCYLPGTTPLRRDYDTGTFHIKYTTLSSTKLNDWQFLNTTNEQVGTASFALAEYIERLTTKFSCDEMDIVNTRKVPIRVHYCVSAYVRYSEIYNLEFEAVTLGQGKTAMMITASLEGFSSRNATEITRRLVNSIRMEPQ